MEKFGRYVISNEKAFQFGLDSINTQKLKDWVDKWADLEKLKADGIWDEGHGVGIESSENIINNDLGE